jgi:hypothetical protein
MGGRGLAADSPTRRGTPKLYYMSRGMNDQRVYFCFVDLSDIEITVNEFLAGRKKLKNKYCFHVFICHISACKNGCFCMVLF